jgi:hypothetical protein
MSTTANNGSSEDSSPPPDSPGPYPDDLTATDTTQLIRELSELMDRHASERRREERRRRRREERARMRMQRRIARAQARERWERRVAAELLRVDQQSRERVKEREERRLWWGEGRAAGSGYGV